MAYSPSDTVSPVPLLQDLLHISLTAVNLLRPLYNPAGELDDFAPEYFNPAAQRMTGLLAERPAGTARTLFPDIFTNGLFAFYRRVFESGEAGHFALNYQADGRDNYFRVAAQRSEELLIVSFTDVTEQELAHQQVEQLHQQVEAARAEAERERAQLQSLLAQAPVAIALLQGEDLRVVSANDRMTELWGYTPADVVGRPLLAGVPELHGQGFDDLMREVMRTRVPFIGKETAAVLLRHGQLQTSYYDFVCHPHYDTDGQVQGVLIVATDVTDQVRSRQQVERLNADLETRVQQRTQEALTLQADLLAVAQRQVQEREAFHAVFEQTPALIALLRAPSHRYEYVNPAYQALFSGRRLVGLDVAGAVPEMQQQGFVDLLDRVYASGETYFGREVSFAVALPGDPVPRQTYFSFTMQAYREAGAIAGISIFAFDATEQVLARREREAQRQQLQDIFEQAPVPITVLRGSELVVESANAAISALWGRPAAQTVGKPYFEAVPDTAGQGFEAILAGVLRTGEPYLISEMPVTLDRAHTGRPAVGNFNFVFQPLRGPDGTGAPVGIVAVGTEVTEQVQAREQVQHLNEELAAMNEALTTANAELGDSNTQLTRTNVDLDNFIYTASHDLKAPITNIEGLLLALEDELPAAARTGDVPLMLTMMQDAIDRFRRTITHLTDLSRLQKEHNPASDAVALAPVVDAVRLDLTPLLTHAQGQLTVSIPEGLTVTFAEKNLRSVVYNLLSNAFKYHHPDRVPEVQLRSWLADDYAVLEVQDNGLGLDLAQGQDKLFAMFQRLHTHVEGTGVGLYMVKRIVENAGGRIDVTSELGRGSTFRVYFPR